MNPAAFLAFAAAGWLWWRQARAQGGAGHVPEPGAADGSIFNPVTTMPNTSTSTGSTPPAPANAPRGIRNNNPGNIELTADRWQGMAAKQTDGRFLQFTAPLYGLRALAKVLLNYQARYGLSTVRSIITRWAPPVENKTTAYVNAVAAAMGIGADTAVDLRARPEYLAKLMRAIVAHENGASWRDYYPASLYQQAIEAAL